MWTSHMDFSWLSFISKMIVEFSVVYMIIDTAFKCYYLPPGPWGLPIVGYAPWIGNAAHKTFMRLGKKYGGLFSLNLGGETVIVFNDWPSVKEALVDQMQIFSGRPHSFLSNSTIGKFDVAFNDGPVWQKQRQLMIRILRNIRFGKTTMEDLVMENVNEILSKLSKCDGKTVEMDHMLFGPILKSNWRQIASHSFSADGKDLSDFEEHFCIIFDKFTPNNPLNLFPWLRFCPPNGFGYWKCIRSYKIIMEFLRKVVEQHRTDYNESNLRDFIDYYLAEIEKEKITNSKPLPPYTIEHLLGSIFDLFLAGVETINSTSLFGILTLAYYPEIQAKIQQELDTVVGRNEKLTMAHFNQLPYLKAFTMEINRVFGGPLALPHMPIHHTIVSDHHILKGITCIQNIYGIHHDPKLWKNPDDFQPERFLDEENKIIKPPYLIPFSVGPRVCIGQSYALLEMRLLFGCIAKQFILSLPPHLPKPTLEPHVGLSLKPQSFSLLITSRT